MSLLTAPCPFLVLPTELRLEIYSALLPSTEITISSAELVGSSPDMTHCLYRDARTPISGLPRTHDAVILPHYDRTFLSVANPPQIHISKYPTAPHRASSLQHYRGVIPLLLVNRQVHAELTSHFKPVRNQNPSLFVSYPTGLHVLRALAPHLLQQAISVHIAGSYTSQGFDSSRVAFMPASRRNEGFFISRTTRPSGTTVLTPAPDSAQELEQLILTLLGPERKTAPAIRKFELRIYYRGRDSYASVWGDDDSPVVVALRNIAGGVIDVEVWRGRLGTAVYLTARPSEDGRRVVSTVWRRLEEGGRQEPVEGAWVVDEKWPAWKEVYEGCEGGGEAG